MLVGLTPVKISSNTLASADEGSDPMEISICGASPK